jgi:hypothetical protein
VEAFTLQLNSIYSHMPTRGHVTRHIITKHVRCADIVRARMMKCKSNFYQMDWVFKRLIPQL